MGFVSQATANVAIEERRESFKLIVNGAYAHDSELIDDDGKTFNVGYIEAEYERLPELITALLELQAKIATIPHLREKVAAK